MPSSFPGEAHFMRELHRIVCGEAQRHGLAEAAAAGLATASVAEVRRAFGGVKVYIGKAASRAQAQSISKADLSAARKRAGGSMVQAARSLGISRSHAYRLLRTEGASS